MWYEFSKLGVFLWFSLFCQYPIFTAFITKLGASVGLIVIHIDKHRNASNEDLGNRAWHSLATETKHSLQWRDSMCCWAKTKIGNNETTTESPHPLYLNILVYFSLVVTRATKSSNLLVHLEVSLGPDVRQQVWFVAVYYRGWPVVLVLPPGVAVLGPEDDGTSSSHRPGQRLLFVHPGVKVSKTDDSRFTNTWPLRLHLFN